MKGDKDNKGYIYKNSEIVRIINNKESKQFKAKIGYKQG